MGVAGPGNGEAMMYFTETGLDQQHLIYCSTLGGKLEYTITKRKKVKKE
jgi:hypothetical protein